MRKLFTCAALALALAAPAIARAEEAASAQPLPAEAATLKVEFTLDAVSDYRFRGVSLSNGKPALQPGVTLTHRSGLYASAWASTVAEDGGPDAEVDLAIGASRPLGPVAVDLSAVWYLYPGDRNADYLELISRTSAAVGAAEIGITAAWAPSQRNIGSRSNRYAALDASAPLPGTPLTVSGSVGIEDGAFADGKRDWSLGLAAEVGGFALGVAYVDSARSGAGKLGRSGLVLSAGRSF